MRAGQANGPSASSTRFANIAGVAEAALFPRSLEDPRAPLERARQTGTNPEPSTRRFILAQEREESGLSAVPQARLDRLGAPYAVPPSRACPSPRKSNDSLRSFLPIPAVLSDLELRTGSTLELESGREFAAERDGSAGAAAPRVTELREIEATKVEWGN